ncbi:HIT-type zinc finger-containing protein C1orf181 [Thecamonas trahens ATCC 50062]|uniref:HIT-type zinc finger-containing protein C1orf181 n=1 Tax=Thecamonas trahens ATCC 50062 TaxID=461836 RepID=A0A0L0DPE6_THETB|nr:HIT-type zinc finger-containing protein C1orf181 [Thecamonas trahens ATCC 50062]KNC54130.1 HIT-type zinc finger-containing protein C1orf181 [Thecamonas trahens ATCC 50062]|eukprot:XP_013753952.1 HIT-type zinc finger-containing protein C1orf181 [Thecamonas trahens ATCC 50062]
MGLGLQAGILIKCLQMLNRTQDLLPNTCPQMQAHRRDGSESEARKRKREAPAHTCEACGGEGIYTCPRCMVRSCSVACVKRHKAESGCSGKRDRTKFVPRSAMSDALVVNDYLLLEDALRSLDAAQRSRNQMVVAGELGTRGMRPTAGPRKGRAALMREAKRRGISLHFMPDASSRRIANRSHYRNKDKHIHWFVEWRHDGQVVDASLVEETALVGDVVRPLLQRHGVAQASLPRVRAWLRKARVPANAPEADKRIAVRLDASLAECLAGQEIIEFPVFDLDLAPPPMT